MSNKKEALGMSLEISQEYIDSLTKDLLQQSLIETLDAKNNIVQNIITEVMNTKVDEHGQKPSYSSRTDMTYIQYLINKSIRDELGKLCEEAIDKSQVRQSIKRELSKKATVDKFVNAFFVGVLDNLNNSWRTKVDINIEQSKNEYEV
jgi:hypothetical protein